MGRKVNPKIFRIGETTDWDSKWFFAKTKSREFLREDVLMREFLCKRIRKAGIDKIEIERSANKIKINILTAKPGMIIGRSGEGAEKIKQELKNIFFKEQKNINFEFNIKEVKSPFLAAGVVLESIIADLEKRMPFRRVLKHSIEQVKKAGAKGIKLAVSGRLDGAEIARREKLAWGKVPLHTLRADIDYARGIAHTIYGCVGVKVWIFRGFKEKEKIINN